MSTEFSTTYLRGWEDLPISELVDSEGPGYIGPTRTEVYDLIDLSVWLVDHDYGAYELLLDYGDVEPISVTLAPSDTLKTGIELGLEDLKETAY